MDPLSQVISLLRPQVLAWRLLEMHAPWAIQFPSVGHIGFGQILKGGMTAEFPDGSHLALNAGDFLLLPFMSSWIAHSGDKTSIVAFKSAVADPSLLLSDQNSPVANQMIVGAFALLGLRHAAQDDLFTGIIHIRSADVEAKRIGTVLVMLGEEAATDQPGRSLILEHLIGIMLVEALRHHGRRTEPRHRGLLGGLAEPQIGDALQLIHKVPQKPWTVASLAREIGMSRSVFARSFMSRVGVSPIGYLTGWRMTLAKSALATSQDSVTKIAEQTGYQSVSAFSSAFTRMTKMTPSRYREQANR